MGPCCTTAGRCVGCSSRGQGQLLTPGTGRCSWHLTNPASAVLQLVIQHNGGMAHSSSWHLLSPFLFFSSHVQPGGSTPLLPSILMPLSFNWAHEVGSFTAPDRLWWKLGVSKGQVSPSSSRSGGWDGSGPLCPAFPLFPMPDFRMETQDWGLAPAAESLLFAESKNRNLLLFLCTTGKN